MSFHEEIVVLDQPVYDYIKESVYEGVGFSDKFGEKDIIVNGEKFHFTVTNDACHYSSLNKVRDLTDYYEDMLVELVRNGVKFVRFLYVTGVPSNGYITITGVPVNADNFERGLFLGGAVSIITEPHGTSIYKYTGLNDLSLKTYIEYSKEELKVLLSQYLRLRIPTSIPEDLLVLQGSKMVELRSVVLRSDWVSTLLEISTLLELDIS